MVYKMLRLIILLFAGLSTVSAQILNPAKWTSESSVADAKTGDEITLTFHAIIDNSWYLYSSEFPCDDGPIKTSFTFQRDKSYELVGGIVPINPIDKHDKIFECDVKIFKVTAAFQQKIKVLAAPLKISGSYEYQVCTELTGQCVPGEGEFIFDNVNVEGSINATGKVENEKSEGQASKTVQPFSVDTTARSITDQKQANADVQGPILD